MHSNEENENGNTQNTYIYMHFVKFAGMQQLFAGVRRGWRNLPVLTRVVSPTQRATKQTRREADTIAV